MTLNHFAYGLNNPFRYVDPSGYDPVRIKGVSDEQKKKAALLNNSHGESDALSFISSFVPGLGDAKDIQEALTGVDLITNKKLTGIEKVVIGICVLLPIVSAKAGRMATKAVLGLADDSIPTFKRTISGKSAKEMAKDVPSWAIGNKPFANENGNEFAKRLLDAKYGPGKYTKGPKSEFNKIRKWGDRGFE